MGKRLEVLEEGSKTIALCTKISINGNHYFKSKKYGITISVSKENLLYKGQLGEIGCLKDKCVVLCAGPEEKFSYTLAEEDSSLLLVEISYVGLDGTLIDSNGYRIKVVEEMDLTSIFNFVKEEIIGRFDSKRIFAFVENGYAHGWIFKERDPSISNIVSSEEFSVLEDNYSRKIYSVKDLVDALYLIKIHNKKEMKLF